MLLIRISKTVPFFLGGSAAEVSSVLLRSTDSYGSTGSSILPVG